VPIYKLSTIVNSGCFQNATIKATNIGSIIEIYGMRSIPIQAHVLAFVSACAWRNCSTFWADEAIASRARVNTSSSSLAGRDTWLSPSGWMGSHYYIHEMKMESGGYPDQFEVKIACTCTKVQ
jgi:hypothetical protein